MLKNAISITNLTVAYNQAPILNNLNLHVQVGTLVAIVGPNGSGKTTLVQSIMGLLPSTGSISIFDQPHHLQQHHIAYIPQRSCVDWTFPLSVLDVVLMGRYSSLKFGQRPTMHDKEIATQAIEQVNMSKYIHQPIGNLSGGQQQRIFLARAIVQQAEIYIMDEPFVGIDMVTEKIMLDIFTQLQQQNKTIIVVHHDLTTVQKYFDFIFLMNRKEIASGPIATTLTQENIIKTFHTAIDFHDLHLL
ncbi:metal ABC transporter ATP-binding protein [Candidatus Babeliales bacterium]|nr:metal ABC transporter ATP-binding protein [Candidatus Babeliales bacterium]MBP9844219.1 metal ABC transporter ATP-binding protein [Candidatus Babeliales bacterium]